MTINKYKNIKIMKVFVHIGAPKAASTTLQHFFHFNNNINFLGT